MTVDARIRMVIAEKDWQNRVVQEARLKGWWVFHDHDSRRNAAGFPDLVLLKPPRLLFVELKTETGALKPAQRQVLRLLGLVPQVEVHLWRPSDEKEMSECLAW